MKTNNKDNMQKAESINLKRNLMMHSAYWRDAYNDAISNELSNENIALVNANISEILVFLRNARKKLQESEHLGGEHTIGFYNQYRQLDDIIETLHKIFAKINKQGYRINLKDYPLK
jgi:hypothetical protein